MSCAEYSDEYCAEYHTEYMYVEYTKVNIGGFVLKERETFGSRLGFILVSAGCAVGLGNVWKFPYICGINGGAAFVLIYLVFLAILGFPIVCAEFTVGRGSGKGAARAYEVLEKKGSKWHYFKWVSVVGSYILMADIDMSRAGADGWKPWNFNGTFDGNGHTLYNMDIHTVTDITAKTYDGNLKEYDTYFVRFFLE